MKRLSTLCTIALAIAACAFALAGCGNVDGSTGPCEPDLGSTKAIEKAAPSEHFDKKRRRYGRPPGFRSRPPRTVPHRS